MPLVRMIFDERVRLWKALPPESYSGSALVDTLVETRSILRSTVFYKVGESELLFSAVDGELLARGVLRSLGPGTVIEMIAELFVLIVSLWGHVGDGGKKAAEEAAKGVAKNPAVPGLLEKLLGLLKKIGKSVGEALGGESVREDIRKVLIELFEVQSPKEGVRIARLVGHLAYGNRYAADVFTGRLVKEVL